MGQANKRLVTPMAENKTDLRAKGGGWGGHLKGLTEISNQPQHYISPYLTHDSYTTGLALVRLDLVNERSWRVIPWGRLITHASFFLMSQS